MTRIALIVGALVVAVLSGLMVSRYLAQQKATIEAQSRQSAPAIRTTEVLVVTAKVPIAGIVSRRMLAWQPWPEANLNPVYITRPARPDALDKLADSAARQPLFPGEPVTETKLIKRGSSGFLASVLEEGRRAVTIKADESVSLGGLVQAGDRVDVILAHKLSGGGPETEAGGGGGGKGRSVSETIVKDVRVLAVDQAFKTDDNAATKVGKTITLEVSPQQAEAIFLGKQMGLLSLALRSAFGEANDDTRPMAYTRDSDVSPILNAERLKRTRVLVAARGLADGTLLADGDVSWIALPDQPDPDQYFVEGRDTLKQLRGSLVTTALAPGQPLERHILVRPSDSRFVPQALRPGMRAVSVAIQPRTAVAGFISPGDLVDVLYTGEVDDKTPGAQLEKRNFSETVVASVRVLSVETAISPETGLPQAGGTATLEATPKQAEMLAVASVMGELVLVLRPAHDRDPNRDPAPAPDPDGGRTGDPVAGGEAVSALAVAAVPAAVPSFTRDLDFSGALRSIVNGGGNPLSGAAGAGPAKPGTPRTITIYRAAQPETASVNR